jgi:hypothetical protein
MASSSADKSMTITPHTHHYHQINLFFSIYAIVITFFILSFEYYQGRIGFPPDIARKTIVLGVMLVPIFFFGALFFLSDHLKKRLLFVSYYVIVIEGFLQCLALLGILPGVSVNAPVPFGRIYWTKEGFSNSWRNRYGWYALPSRVTERSKKIVVIGDSFIQALQVPRNDHLDVILQQLLHSHPSNFSDGEVIALGESGFGPAYYWEVLQYASRYFAPDEVILFLFLGNDIRNSSYTLQPVVPSQYIYYQLQDNQYLRLHPESVAVQQQFQRRLEVNHSTNVWYLSGEILRSYLLLPPVLGSIVTNTRQFFVRKAQEKNARPDEQALTDRLQTLGLDALVFQKNLSAEANEAYQITTRLLEICQQYANAHHIRLRLVTIPFFPDVFYMQSVQTDQWSSDMGGYDFLLPENIFVEFAAQHQIPILPMGRYLRDDHKRPEEIRQLYFNDGEGHFTQEGHRYFANAIYRYFYSQKSKRLMSQSP